jgi:16S rRNA (guanine527-N7)-methyltransferase
MIPSSVGPESLDSYFDVSRESLQKLTIYVDELLRWQDHINLIAPSTCGNIWHRHVCDGLQLADIVVDTPGPIIDIGSGSGIPAIPVAILMKQLGKSESVTMIESNAKKCAFLRNVSRLCQIDSRIINKRVESLDDSAMEQFNYVVTARAVAPLTHLLDLVDFLPGSPQRMLFLKGQDVDVELTEATKCWKIAFEVHSSRTHKDGCVLEIYEAERVSTSNSLNERRQT